MVTPSGQTVRQRFFAPVTRALEAASHGRKCLEYDDETFLIAGISRVIENAQSGRDWVQRLQTLVLSRITVANFFRALRSPRRRRLTEEVSGLIRDSVDRDCDASHDPLAQHEELRGFEVYASDGHYQAAATHTQPIAGKVQPQGNFAAIAFRCWISRAQSTKENTISPH
jgi:hypothetical protein